ncbi:fumarylacetoacetate hydrolase family protein [Cupriavidus basilensis]
MKFLTFERQRDDRRLGIMLDDAVVLDLTAAWPQQDIVHGEAPRDIGELIELGDSAVEAAGKLQQSADVSCRTPLADIRILAPIPAPRRNVFCVGRNYREHIIEANLALGRDPNNFPQAPEFFSKPPDAVIGHLAHIKRHASITEFLDYEVELGIVIGKTGVDISREDAMNHVFGYTIVNDVTARDLQVRHGQWMKGKSLDTSCPMGPVIVHRSAVPDPHDLMIELDVNGELRQRSRTSSMVFQVPDIIAELSAGTTLRAGDIIATGTPSGVGLGLTPQKKLQAGDVIRARISGIGELENTVIG